jgi:hypothetical protein
VFGARYPASSQDWLRAICDEDTPMPVGDGFVWTAATAPDLLPARMSEAA